MKDLTIKTLNEILTDNLGQKLTPALATGILTQLNVILTQQEAPKEE